MKRRNNFEDEFTPPKRRKDTPLNSVSNTQKALKKLEEVVNQYENLTKEIIQKEVEILDDAEQQRQTLEAEWEQIENEKFLLTTTKAELKRITAENEQLRAELETWKNLNNMSNMSLEGH